MPSLAIDSAARYRAHFSDNHFRADRHDHSLLEQAARDGHGIGLRTAQCTSGLGGTVVGAKSRVNDFALAHENY
jgi:hypothetical protein